MGFTTYVPLFQVSGFGPLRLPTSPSAYGLDPSWIPTGPREGPSGASSLYLQAGGVGDPASLSRILTGDRGGLSAAQRKPGDSKSETSRVTLKPDSGVQRIEATYALKFDHGKFRGTEFSLKPEGEMMIGRAAGLDIVLSDTGVSQKHAKLRITGGQVTIEDLGSTSGTFVNGKKITKQLPLKEGDRVLIGPSIMRLVAAQPQPQAPAANAQEAGAAPVSTVSTVSSVSLIRGNLQDMPLFDLLQLFQMSRKSGVLRLHGDHEGRVYLREGKVVYADIDGNAGPDPAQEFYKMVTWEKGNFDLTPPEDRKFPTEINQPIEHLLMEGLRLLDESRKGESHKDKDESPTDELLKDDLF